MLPSRSPAKGPFADTWFAEIDRIHAGVSGRLLAFVESCADLGVSYGINKVMIIRMQVGNIMIQPFGIEANGEVSIPWFIAGKKKEFRHFAHLVADAIPGTYARDTAKQWVVRMADRKVDVLEFLGASEAILAALPGLNASLRNSDSPLVVD